MPKLPTQMKRGASVASMTLDGWEVHHEGDFIARLGGGPYTPGQLEAVLEVCNRAYEKGNDGRYEKGVRDAQRNMRDALGIDDA